MKSFSNSIYFYDKVGEDVPDFIEDPGEFLPKNLPPVDFVLIVGIHQDLLSGLPYYLKDKNDIKAVIIPVEDPKWVPAGLQVQVLEEFEKYGIQAAFPKPFCALSKDVDEYNKIELYKLLDFNTKEQCIILANDNYQTINYSFLVESKYCRGGYEQMLISYIINEDLENKRLNLYLKLSKIFLLFAVLFILWIIVISIGIYVLELTPSWTILSLENWVLIFSVLIGIFILLEIIFYFHYISKYGKRIGFRKIKHDSIKGKNLFVYTNPSLSESGIFSRTYIEIDKE